MVLGKLPLAIRLPSGLKRHTVDKVRVSEGEGRVSQLSNQNLFREQKTVIPPLLLRHLLNINHKSPPKFRSELILCIDPMTRCGTFHHP